MKFDLLQVIKSKSTSFALLNHTQALLNQELIIHLRRN